MFRVLIRRLVPKLCFLLQGWLLIACCVLIWSCAPKVEDAKPPEEVTPARVLDEPDLPEMTLQELLEQKFSSQYSSLASVFDLPADPLRQGLIMLSHEKPVLTLAREVSAYNSGSQALAVGSAGGDIQIYSPWPCHSISLPGQEAAREIFWNGEAPFLCAIGHDRQELTVFDLQKCVQAGQITTKGPVQNAAVSPDGQHLAVVDEGRRLWTGKVQGDLELQATLRFDVLDITFTPESGLLMAADSAGWLIIWHLPDYEVLEQKRVSGGPFQQAEFAGAVLNFRGADNPEADVAWDIIRARKLEPEHNESFMLEDETLYYVWPEKQYVKKAILSSADLQVLVDPELMVFKVADLDGESRFYDARSGEPVESAVDTAKMSAVQVSGGGEFSWAETDYQLADAVKSSADWTLWARYIPDKGHYLWWTAGGGQKAIEFGGQLPHRSNIRKEIPADWRDLME